MTNDIVTLMTAVGEIVGRLKSETDNEYVIETPRLFAQTQEGVGFVPGICMTGAKDPKEASIRKETVLFVVKTDDMIAKSWIQQTTGIVLAS